MRTDKTIHEGRRKRIEHQVKALPGILDKVYAKKDYRRVGHNVNLVGRDLLLRGMMLARIEGDAQGARADFALACGLTREFDRALELIRQGPPPEAPAAMAPSGGPTAYLAVDDFEVPLFACVLAMDWPRVESVARMTRDAHVRESKEDPTGELMARLLAAFVLDERAVFAQLKSTYDERKKSAWSKHFIVYVEMYESVCNRDQARYDDLAGIADQQFRARARDRKFGDLRPEYGGLAENELVLDFYALAIAIVALKRGMRPGHSDLVPTALVTVG